MDILKYWSKRQKELDSALDIAIKRGNVDTDTLKTMKEMLDKIRVKERTDGGNKYGETP
jgi:hypothetical protein